GEDLVAAPDAAPDRVVGRDLVEALGDTGCANVLLNLGLALERAVPGESILAQAYGAGAVTVSALVRVGERARCVGGDAMDDARVQLSYLEYARRRGLLPI